MGYLCMYSFSRGLFGSGYNEHRLLILCMNVDSCIWITRDTCDILFLTFAITNYCNANRVTVTGELSTG